MPSSISRRRFLRDSAIVSGGAVLVGVDPGRASAVSTSPSAADRRGSLPGRGERSDGPFAQIEYGDAREGFLVRWTRAGGSSSMELTVTTVRLDVPIWGAQEIDLADVERGRSEHEIVQYFGAVAHEQLRHEIRQRRVFNSS